MIKGSDVRDLNSWWNDPAIPIRSGSLNVVLFISVAIVLPLIKNR